MELLQDTMVIMVNLLPGSINKRWDALFLLFYFSVCVGSIEMAFSLLVHTSMSM